MMKQESINRRRHIRFRPDSHEYAQLDPTSDPDQEFQFKFVGLIVEEAPMGGCSLITYDTIDLKDGASCRVKLGLLNPVLATVVWQSKEDGGLVRIGLKFEE